MVETHAVPDDVVMRQPVMVIRLHPTASEPFHVHKKGCARLRLYQRVPTKSTEYDPETKLSTVVTDMCADLINEEVTAGADWAETVAEYFDQFRVCMCVTTRRVVGK